MDHNLRIGAFVGRNEIGSAMFSNLYSKFDFFIYDKLTPSDIKHLEDSDLIFLLWWPSIIPKEVVDIPRIGIVNMHPSILPYCRGRDPYFWSIVDGTPFGLTIHFIDESIDTGDIIFQEMIPVTLEDTGETLYKKALELAPMFLADKIDDIIDGNYTRTPQVLNEGSRYYKGEMEGMATLIHDTPMRVGDVFDIFRARSFPVFDDGAKVVMPDGKTYQITVEIKEVDDGRY